MKNNILFFLLVIIVSACQQKSTINNSRVASLPFYNNAIFTPHWLDVNDKLLETFHQISPFKLLNQDGDTITEKTFEDGMQLSPNGKPKTFNP